MHFLIRMHTSSVLKIVRLFKKYFVLKNAKPFKKYFAVRFAMLSKNCRFCTGLKPKQCPLWIAQLFVLQKHYMLRQKMVMG